MSADLSLSNNAIWKEDLKAVIANTTAIDVLKGKKILITGASGLLCSSVVDLLLQYNDIHTEKITIYAAGRDSNSMHRRFGNCYNRQDFIFVPYNALETNNCFDFEVDYIIHGASNSYPSKVIAEPVETMVANILGVKNLLDYVRNRNVKRLLYISSSEVYGKLETDMPITETEHGYFDILDPRSAYSIGKCSAETLCSSYSAEYDIDTVIARPGHIYGPSVNKADTRVSSMWTLKAALGEDIVIKSDGKQIRSYCYCLDCASAIITILANGEKGKAYNISDDDCIISIGNLALLIAKAGNVSIYHDVPDNTEKRAFNPMTNSSLNGNKLLAMGWNSIFTPELGINHTIEILKNITL